MVTNSKKKYIESHWLVFGLQGVVALLFGWYVMFTGITDIPALIAVVGCTLLALGIIEAFNLLHRKRMQYSWGLSLAISLIEIAVAILLLFTMKQNVALLLTILAAYTLLRGIFEILIALHSITDSTDRFMWLVCGICGAIMGFVILNSGHFVETTTFIKFFGSYMMIFGITNLIYGIHNRNESKEQLMARRAAAKARRLEKAKSTKKKTGKTSK